VIDQRVAQRVQLAFFEADRGDGSHDDDCDNSSKGRRLVAWSSPLGLRFEANVARAGPSMTPQRR